MSLTRSGLGGIAITNMTNILKHILAIVGIVIILVFAGIYYFQVSRNKQKQETVTVFPAEEQRETIISSLFEEEKKMPSSTIVLPSRQPQEEIIPEGLFE